MWSTASCMADEIRARRRGPRGHGRRRRPRRVDAGSSRCASSCSEALFGESADAVIPHVRLSFPVVSEHRHPPRRGDRPGCPRRCRPRRVRLRARLPPARPVQGCATTSSTSPPGSRVVTPAGTRPASTALTIAARDGGERHHRRVRAGARREVLVFLLAGHETTSTAADRRAPPARGAGQDVQDAVRADGARGRRRRPPDRRVTRSIPHLTTRSSRRRCGSTRPPFVSRLAVADDEDHGPPRACRDDGRPRAVDDPPPPRLLGGPAHLRPLAVRPRGRGRGAPAPLRVDAVRRGPAGVHRPALLGRRGAAGAGRRFPGPSASRQRVPGWPTRPGPPTGRVGRTTIDAW